MKKPIRYFILLIIDELNKIKLFKKFIEISYNSIQRADLKTAQVNLDNLFKNSLMVKNGPFAGLKYPNLNSHGSALFPKILGSYEAELHSSIYDLSKFSFKKIYVIGCAEGYYVGGFARLFKQSKVYGVDTNEKARKMCNQLVELNQLHDQVEITEKFLPEDLYKIDLAESLIFCDAEGFELDLISKKTLHFLKDTFLLIETHDFLKLGTTKKLTELLSQSHKITIIQSVDDTEKPILYRYDELNSLTLEEKFEIMKENRPGIMKWIYAKPKK